ncbi:uncharacterized protein LOC143910086 [Arctopsyche grandis]|uniref:uncharacterized protein LOC143910086 n=1 Tax=Arctopsyche grandis TaxID=121162 RepID=UPI00406D89C1
MRNHIAVYALLVTLSGIHCNMSIDIFDFTKMDNVNDWIEQSDPVRTVGMSKAVLTLQKTQIFQRAIFFALLNPQPNGAGFAGMRKIDFIMNLREFDGLELRCRAQGEFNGFKIVLRHKNMNDEPNVSYEQMFQGPKNDFQLIKLPFENFKPYFRGRQINDTEPLDQTKITGFGIQFYGGVYLPMKQKGPATLEIDWIKAYKTNDV